MNEEVNCMNTINLAICFAPSLLWPDSGLDVIKNEVPPLVQFMIEHSPKIYGAELPELYKHVLSPGSPGVEQMEFSYESSPSLIPTKMRDGSESSHKRTESIDSSLSEDSLYNKNSLLRAKRNGLTFSDSQLSTISQHDYEPPRRTGSKHESRHTPSSHAPPLGAPVNKRVKKVSQPKRSSSLQGPNDMSPSSRRFYERRQLEARRRSLAMQDLPLKKLRQEYTPGVHTIPDSPGESQSSSSQDYHSPHIHSRAPYYSDNRHMYHQYSHSHEQKKRRAPQHSNSFSKGSENKPVKTMASSASWYDRLLPLEPDAKIKSRSMGTSLGNRLPLPEDSDSQQLHIRVGSGPIIEDRVFDNHSPRFVMTTSYPSNQSMSSSRSGSSASGAIYHGRGVSNKPSNISMSSVSSGGVNPSTNDPFAPISPSLYSVTDTKISPRLDVASELHVPPPSTSPSSYYVPITESEIPSTYNAGSVEEQLKPLDRKRLNSTTSVASESSFSKNNSYKGFLSSQQKKDSLLSLTQASLDDRPESDQHLHSLPRRHMAELSRTEKQLPSAIMYPSMTTAPQVLQVGPVLETTTTDHDPNKLYPGNGYNSDTESSPSRTLNRPDRKILEVTSPGITMPKRYGRMGYSAQGKKLLKAHTIDDPSPPMQVDTPTPTKESVATIPTELPKEELSTSTHNTQEQAPASSPSTKKMRPKSGENSKIGQLVKTYSKPTLDPNYETAKVRLGLIPPMRQRSKSTSEKEAMRIIHKIIEEDESAAKNTEEEERAEKHKAWASSAPTTADRKKAWESLSKDSFKRAEIRSRSLKHETNTPVIEKPIPKPSMTPEMKRRSATMPEYLVTGPKRIRGVGRQIRTYKVALYDAPKPERIRRINLRTIH